MKILRLSKNFIVAVLAGATGIVALAAWSDGSQFKGGQQSRFQDTVPTPKRTDDTRQPRSRDLDKELKHLQEAQKNLEKLNEVNWQEISEQVELSIKNIDAEKIKMEVQKELAAIDIEKIKVQVEKELESIDFEKIRQDIKEVQQIDMKKINEEIEKAMVEMKAAKIDLKDVQVNMQEMEKELKEGMKTSKAELAKATKKLSEYQTMIYEMEKDGLLNTNSDYSIEFEDQQLLINGQVQTKLVTDKFRKYFSNEPFKITKRDGDMNISKPE